MSDLNISLRQETGKMISSVFGHRNQERFIHLKLENFLERKTVSQKGFYN